VLLGLTYGLVASSLPGGKALSAQNVAVIHACKVAGTQHGKAQKAPDPLLAQCKKAFAAGASSGSRSQRDRALSNLLLFSLIGLGAMTVASGGLGWIVSGRVLRPIRSITETARRASEQHLGERLALAGPNDELKELADTFDDMLERLDAAFAGQKQFVANASHELRTPLTLMRTAIDVTLAKPARTPEQLELMAGRVRRSIDRAEAMVDGLLTLAVSQQGQARHEDVDLATMAEDALDAASSDIEAAGLTVDAVLDPAETVGDQLLLDRMIANLVTNAVRHNNAGGSIRVRTGTAGQSAFFEVANSGPFVPEADIPSLFEPFGRAAARVRPTTGVGLGLSIVQAIGVAHGATVVTRSQPEGGLAVSVVLSARRTGVESVIRELDRRRSTPAIRD